MSYSKQITDEVTAWPGVEAGLGRRGEFGFTVGRKQIGHLHGDRVAHFGFPKAVGSRLLAEGRVEPHPVFPGNPGFVARAIGSEADVREVVELLRLNYDRVAKRRAPAGIRPSDPHPLPFAPDTHVRSFVLEREHGDLLVYGAPDPPAGATRHYLNHWHEAMFGDESGAPLFVNEHDREATEQHVEVAHVFSKRHVLDGDFEVIPTPGHTPGATAFLWDNGEQRLLFTGDTIYLRHGEWVTAVLDSSDRQAYVESLELMRELDFDVLVPWGASAGEQWYAETGRDDARRRLGALITHVRNGGD
jgi:hypothetical protein